LIEWELGKAAQPITGKDGGAVAVQFVEIVRPKDDSTLPD